MKRSLKIALVAALPIVSAACNDFLTGGELENDPNRPTVAEPSQYFLAVQSRTWTFQTGQWARLVCMWMQQCTGTDRQYTSLGVYEVSEGIFDGSFNEIYAGGGLNDIKQMKAAAQSSGDLIFVGVAQVLEALMIGTAADLFGDVPYSEAASGIGGAGPVIATPKLDDQAAVYAAIQTLLDEAIDNLGSGEGSGPGSADFVYGGDPDAWTELAYTLKARFYMHTAETTPGNYALALAAAANGISSSANDYVTVHSGAAGEANLWYQFIEEQRQDYISPGAFLLDSILEARTDPRLDEYFDKRTPTAPWEGATPGSALTNTTSRFDADRIDQAASQPIVTYVENLLIQAEAAYRTNDQVTALARLNAARATDGLGPVALAGAALLNEIMIEKYIQLFQQLEVWNDWKRTCVPNLTPALTAAEIPRRFIYPTSERQTNPNIPLPSAQPTHNDNDPTNAGCRGQTIG